ncbi:MAG: gamma-glutamyl-gamma-aminobutyrate hydrolase family protein [Geminicoccaceae bacterium]
MAPGLVVEATADDGTIEAVSAPSCPGFALAVQWHPEWRVRENPVSTRLFAAFAEACRARAATRVEPRKPAERRAVA